jgi:hypothetical protein
LATICDTTERHRTNEVLREEARFGYAILGGLSFPIVVVNVDGTIQACHSPAQARWF